MRNLQNDRKTGTGSSGTRTVGVLGSKITPAFSQENAGLNPSLLPGNECCFAREMAANRLQAVAARALRDPGTVRHRETLSWCSDKFPRLSYLFCYNSKCSSGLSANLKPRRNGSNRCVLSFGVATLRRFLGDFCPTTRNSRVPEAPALGDLGWNWVNIGERRG